MKTEAKSFQCINTIIRFLQATFPTINVSVKSPGSPASVHQVKNNSSPQMFWLKSDQSPCCWSTVWRYVKVLAAQKSSKEPKSGEETGLDVCWAERLRGERWERLSVCEGCNKDPLCVPISICLCSPSTSRTLPRKQKLFDTLGQSWLWESTGLSHGSQAAAFLRSPSSLPKQAGCTHELPCIQSGQCWVSASLLTPESFGKPSRKLSVWGVTRGGEEETDREREAEEMDASRGWLSNLFSFHELLRQCVLLAALARYCQNHRDLECLLSFFIYLILYLISSLV